MPSNRPLRKADLKVVLLGDANVGKTSLVLRYIDRRFQETVSTIGASFLLKHWGNYNIAIWDTAGEEKYSGLGSFYCRNAAAAILAFDLTNRQSFETLSHRYIPLLQSVNCQMLVLAGTKKDLLRSCPREVCEAEVLEFAKSLKPDAEVPYFETSSRIGHNVDELFEHIFEHFFPGRGSQPRPPSPSEDLYESQDAFQLSNGGNVPATKQSSCCS